MTQGARLSHDDVINWKHFPRYWPFVRGIHRSLVNSPHKAQWRGALMFSLICVWINGWVNNREAGDLRRYRAHYDVTVMSNHNTAWWRHNMKTLVELLALVRSLKMEQAVFDVFLHVGLDKLLNKHAGCQTFEGLLWHHCNELISQEICRSKYQKS